MVAYYDVYLDDVVENQGKLFDYVSYNFPNKDTKDFIECYMSSKTREAIDNGQAYVITMDYKDLLDYFCKYDNYTFKNGKPIEGFAPDWIGEFYAYYQWYYNIKSDEFIKKIPVDFLLKAYGGLHDLQLDLAVKKLVRLNKTISQVHPVALILDDSFFHLLHILHMLPLQVLNQIHLLFHQ